MTHNLERNYWRGAWQRSTKWWVAWKSKEMGSSSRATQSQKHNKNRCFFFTQQAADLWSSMSEDFWMPKIYTDSRGKSASTWKRDSASGTRCVCVVGVAEQKSHLAQKTLGLKSAEGRRALWGKYLTWLSCSYSCLVICSWPQWTMWTVGLTWCWFLCSCPVVLSGAGAKIFYSYRKFLAISSSTTCRNTNSIITALKIIIFLIFTTSHCM